MELPSIGEVVRSQISGVRRVIAVSMDGTDPDADLGLPTGVTYEVADEESLDDESLGPEALLLAIVSRASGLRVDAQSPLVALRSLGSGGRFAIVVPESLAADRDDQLAQALAASRCEVTEVLGVAMAGGGRAILGQRSDWVARPGEANGGADPLTARLLALNRLVFDAFAIRTAEVAPAVESSADPAYESRARRMAHRLRATEDRLAAVEASTSYQLGRTIVGAARSPRRILRIVPDLARIWRRRSGVVSPARTIQGPSSVDAAAVWHDAIEASPERLFVAYADGAGDVRNGLSIAGVIRDETAATLKPDATVHRLGPNDALLVLERSDPDIVLIETGEFSAGRAWAFTGSSTAIDRDRQLIRVLDAARALGRPSVLWRTPAHPDAVGMSELAGRFDLVLDHVPTDGHVAWTPGVQLSRYNAIDIDPDRESPPLFLGAWDPRAPRRIRARLEELLTAAARDGLDIHVDANALGDAEWIPSTLRGSVRGRAGVADSPRLYRTHPVVIADPFQVGDGTAQILEAVACGARVVALPVATAAGELDEAVTVVADDRSAASVVRDALAAGPRSDAAIRGTLRVLFQDHSVPAALAFLVRQLGVRANPLADREVAILLSIDRAGDLAQVVDAALGQTHQPSEIVVAVADGILPQRSLDAIVDAGISLQVITPEDARPSWATLAAASSRPWVVPWLSQTRHSPSDLVDLLAARESARADVVGFAPGDASRFVPDVSLVGSLIRRDLLVDGVRPWSDDDGDVRLASWGRRGARLFGIPTTSEGG